MATLSAFLLSLCRSLEQMRREMIERREGETMLRVRVHCDGMVTMATYLRSPTKHMPINIEPHVSPAPNFCVDVFEMQIYY